MAGISTPGVGSGLDVKLILEKIEKAERKALEPISRQQTLNTAKLSAYGTLKTSFQKFQTASETLAEPGIYSATTASVSSSAVNATSGSGAVPGRYRVGVLQLAESQTLTSEVRKDMQAPLGNNADQRTLRIRGNNGKDTSIILLKDQTSLTAIRDAINKSDSGLSASLVKVSGSGFRLTLTTQQTGTDNAIKSLEVTGDDVLHNFIGFGSAGKNSGMIQNVAAQNARLTVNKIDIESSSNIVENVVEGVTLRLNEVTVQEQTVTVTKDNDKASSAISEWVEAYNSLQSTIASLTRYTPVAAGKEQDSKNGALFGDGTLRDIQSRLMGAITTGSGSSVYRTLGQTGISLTPADGKLKLDATKLNNILSVRSDEVRNMFSGNNATTGVATGIVNTLNHMLSNKGIFQSATDSINNRLSTLKEQYDNASKRIDENIARYKLQFTRLDRMVSRLNNTGEYLAMQFNNLRK